jgi:hypothetical protein
MRFLMTRDVAGRVAGLHYLWLSGQQTTVRFRLYAPAVQNVPDHAMDKWRGLLLFFRLYLTIKCESL